MTKISFKPDFKKFGLKGLDDDHLSLFRLRVYDMAAWTDKKVNISLNGRKIGINSFERYTDLYFGLHISTIKSLRFIVHKKWRKVLILMDFCK